MTNNTQELGRHPSASSRPTMQTLAAPTWHHAKWALALTTMVLFLANVNVLALSLGLPERYFNPLLLVFGCLTLAAFGSELRYAFSPVMRWALGFLTVFLATATYSVLYSPYVTFTLIDARNGFQRYAATILILLASFCIGSWAVNTARLQTLLKVLFAVNTFAALSPLIFALLPGVTIALSTTLSSARVSGLFFLDPNEYALQSLYSLALGTVLSIRTAQARWALIGLAASTAACFLSISKAGILCLLLLLISTTSIATAIRWRSLRPGAMLLGTLLLGLFLILWLIISVGVGRSAASLALEHRERLEHVWAILATGRLDDETTTHRTGLWKQTLQVCWESPFIGHGLTSMDFIPGIVDRAPHNTFLVIFGEAGLVGLLALTPLLLSCIRVLLQHIQADIKALLLTFLVIQLFLWFTLSNTLWIRPQNLMTGCILGIVTATLVRERSPARACWGPLRVCGLPLGRGRRSPRHPALFAGRHTTTP